MHILYLCANAAQLVGTPQTFWEANKTVLTILITWVVGLGGTWLARYHISPNAWYSQLLRIVIGAVGDSIQPAQFKQMAAQAKATKLEAKSKMRSALNASLLLMTLAAAIACGGSLQKQLAIATLVEQQAVKYEAELAKMVEDAIAFLPVDQRPAAEAKYNDIKTRLDTSLTALETALENATVAASTSGLNINQLIGDVTTLVSDLVSLVAVFAPAKAVDAQKIGLAMIQSHARAQLVLQ